MIFIFVHDHKFRFDGMHYYSTGGLGENVLTKYISAIDEIHVFARIVPMSKGEELSVISDKRIHIYPFNKKIFTNLIKRADYCIVRLPSLSGIFAIKPIKQYDKKYLVEVVGSAKDSYKNHGIVGRFVAPLIEMLTKKAVKTSPYVTYVTQQYLQSAYPNSYNNIGVSDVQIENIRDDILSNRLRKIDELDHRKCIIATIGNYSVRYKSQETIIRALGKLKRNGNNKYKYYLVGSGNSEYLKKIVAEESLEDSVKFVGAIQHECIFKFLDDIDIYTQPSLLEGLCRSVIEAMSRGCPCLLSRVGGNPELIEDKYLFSHGKDSVEQVINILNSFDKETMKKSAIRNFNEAHKYIKTDLDKKWNDFYKIFLSDNGVR